MDNSFRQACQPYFVPGESVISVDPPAVCDNSFLFTSTYFFIAFNIRDEPRAAFADDINSYRAAVYAKQLRPGLYNAFQSWGDTNLSHDELLGLAMIKDVCASIHAYGVRHLWVFNNLGGLKHLPGAFMGRFPLLVAFIRSGAGVKQLNPLVVLLAALELLLADMRAPLGDTSGRCRRFLMARFLYSENRGLLRWAAGIYLKRLQKQYGDIAGLYAIYFHGIPPFAAFTKGVKFV